MVYSCECGRGWLRKPDGMGCEKIRCDADQCLSTEDALNTCVLDGDVDWHCQCNEAVWATAVDGKECIRKQCARDECLSSRQPGNICIGDAANGRHTCLCATQLGWLNSGTPPTACIPPVCSDDECSTSVVSIFFVQHLLFCLTKLAFQSSKNVCSVADFNVKQYTCSCDQENGWVVSLRKDSTQVHVCCVGLHVSVTLKFYLPLSVL